MMNWFRRKKEKREINLMNYGTLKLKKHGRSFYWDGNVNWNASKLRFDLSIEAKSESVPSEEQMARLKNLEDNWYQIENDIFDLLYKCFKRQKLEKSIDEIRAMYYLSMIEIFSDSSKIHLTFEAESMVTSKYNFLPLFTIRENTIVWSNLAL